MFEQRDRKRIPYRTKVRLRTNGSLFVDAFSKDVSIKGMYAHTNVYFPVNTQCNVEIILGGDKTKLVMLIRGKVVRKEEGGVAVHFEDDLEWWPLFNMYKKYDQTIVRA